MAATIRYTNHQLNHRTLFGSDYPLIAPDRRRADAGPIPVTNEVRPLMMKENAVRLRGARQR